jgi:hypothetical protein
MTAMDKSQFRLWDHPASLTGLAEWAHDEMTTETVICPAKDGHQRGGKRLTDLSIKVPGSKVLDIVWTWPNDCLLTDRVLELFRSGGFTGFDVKPVKAVFKRAKGRPPRLWELVVTGWGGIAPLESGVKLLERCDACNLRYYSICTRPEKLIVPSQWDGSDFFSVWPIGATFVTERVAKVIRENKITGVVLKLPSELDMSGNLTGKVAVGPLSDYLPESRVREIENQDGPPPSP